MNSEKIIAGPWVGEFGWELFQWQNHLRYLSLQGFKITPIIRPGHEFLYRDFIENFIYFNPGKVETNMWSCRGMNESVRETMDLIISSHTESGYSHLSPSGTIDLKQSKFISYDINKSHGNHIVIHPRSEFKYQTAYRNWPVKNWINLVNELNKLKKIRIYTVGTIEGAFKIPGTVDIRGISLEELASFMSSARLCVGPSSGPMHFASLCKTKQITWSDRNATGVMNNRERYEKIWNPFNTAVNFIDDEGWIPTVSRVLDTILRELK